VLLVKIERQFFVPEITNIDLDLLALFENLTGSMFGQTGGVVDWRVCSQNQGHETSTWVALAASQAGEKTSPFQNCCMFSKSFLTQLIIS